MENILGVIGISIYNRWFGKYPTNCWRNYNSRVPGTKLVMNDPCMVPCRGPGPRKRSLNMSHSRLWKRPWIFSRDLFHQQFQGTICLMVGLIYGLFTCIYISLPFLRQLYMGNYTIVPWILCDVGIMTGLNDSLYLFGIFLIQLMVNCWFWGLVVWIPRIPRKWKGLGYLGVSRFESQNHRAPNQQLDISH